MFRGQPVRQTFADPVVFQEQVKRKATRKLAKVSEPFGKPGFELTWVGAVSPILEVSSP